MSPNGQEPMIPIEVFSCGNCGKVPDKMMQKEMNKDTGVVRVINYGEV